MRRSTLLILLFLLLPATVNAQNAATVTLTIPITDAFPQIEAYLDIHDSQGNFVHDLLAEHISVLEDNQQAPVSQLTELRPGVQIVTALNPGPALGVRNSQAVSRLDIVKETLRAWASSRRGSTIDDWSLLITNGGEVSHVPDPFDWIKVLDQDQTDAREAVPDLDTLFQAISLAADTPPRAGMSRAVLFITPPPETDTIIALENLFAQAIQQEIHIFVWLVSGTGGATTQGAQRLIQLSALTGGESFVFSGEETLPSPEAYLESLRSIYHLVYQSNLTGSGTHQVIAQLQIGGEQISSNPQSFELNIQPPLPALISPPIQILRQLLDEEQEQPQEETAAGIDAGENIYYPSEQQIQVVFDFPDGRKRPLVYSALFVDGQLVDANQEEPFDQFSWDLQGYTDDGIHNIQVQVRDELGLEGLSIETPVHISIERVSVNPWDSFKNNIPIISGLIVLVAGSVLLLVLLVGGRLKPGSLGKNKNRRRKSDPVTQPVPVKEENPQRFSSWVNRLQWAQRASSPKAHAFMTRISEKDYLATEPPIPIIHRETAIGKDPAQANLVLDDPSIENIHTHLKRTSKGDFRVTDEGTIAGTWINYSPLAKGGAILEHGDLIHIGKIGFRFTLQQPTRVRKLVVKLEPNSEKTVEETSS